MIRLLATTLILLTLGSAATAHPHVFVDVRGTFVLDDRGRLAAVRINWLYDEFTSLVLYDTLGLDADGDGVLDAADLKKVETGETDWPPDYKGDTYLLIDGEDAPLSRPREAKAEIDGDRIGVGFTLYLENPLDMAGRTANLQLYDPAYYYAYSVTEGSGLDEPAEGCSVSIVPFEPSAETADIRAELSSLSREEIPENPNIGALFAENIYLSCM